MLKFTRNNFKILVLGDVQVHGLPSAKERKNMKTLVEKTKPDFIVFLGDMISGVGGYKKSKLSEMIKAIINSTAGHKIPFAIVSGNHDHYVKTTFSKQVDIYRSFKNCLTPAISDRSCKKGYTIDVSGKDNKPALRFLFLDCAGTNFTRFGLNFKATKPSTLAYTRNVLKSSSCPPVIVFQHITVPDVFRLFDIRDQKFPGSVRGGGAYRGLRIGLAHKDAGILGECPCPSWKNVIQFSDWRKSGKVKAAIFAHDHKNSFVDTLDGIKIVQVPCTGLSCTGNDSIRGAHLLTIKPDGSLTSTPLYHKDL